MDGYAKCDKLRTQRAVPPLGNARVPSCPLSA